MTGLDLADGCVGGLLAWFSLIHVPDDEVPAVLAETLTSYLEQLRVTRRPGTVANEDEALREFACFLARRYPDIGSAAEVDRGHVEDYKRWLEWLAPFDPSPEKYQHNRTGEDNADAHHKRQVMGREVVLAVTGGRLDFGPWEQIFYGEFDGRRAKRVLVKVIGE